MLVQVGNPHRFDRRGGASFARRFRAGAQRPQPEPEKGDRDEHEERRIEPSPPNPAYPASAE